MTGLLLASCQSLLRQIPLATDKLLSQHPPPSGELKNVETNPNSQAVIMTCLPLDLDGKSRLYQVALSANATSEGFCILTDFCKLSDTNRAFTAKEHYRVFASKTNPC